MSESNELAIDGLRNPSELPHHWKLRKEFLSVYEGKFDHDRLISLSHLFVNIKCLGLTYPQEVMDKVEELGKSIDTKLIQEASVEESYESRDSEVESQQQQPSSRHNNYNNNNYSNHQNNNQSRHYASNQPFGNRPYSRPRFQQSNHDSRHQPYQQQNQQQHQSYRPQRYNQQHQQQQQQYQQQQQPEEFARYSGQPRFFRPQELRPRSDRQQSFGDRQPSSRPRQRGNYRGASDGYN